MYICLCLCSMSVYVYVCVNVITNLHGNITFRKLKIHLLCFMYKSVFNIHDPKRIKYLFQLRKKHHNFADTPSDIYACNQGIEDIRHLLFECLKLATHRASLAVTVTEVLRRNNLIDLAINFELYLYCHPSLISVDNKRILSATIQYIKNTQRFVSE